ncbi:unnamed protein product [Soboliphyme baturini]|uniref:Cytochrome c oxidase subunit 6B n=1 Tax=Soboliphyme baturini TaxID=241478 RepID=A0A183IBI9_9BILA|nr:unnamed protein product [Soboliphyme baturini]
MTSDSIKNDPFLQSWELPDKLPYKPDDKIFFSKEANNALAEKLMLRKRPVDLRFTQTNRVKQCYTNFIDYHRCLTVREEDNEVCQFFKQQYNDCCPNEWIDKWNQWIKEGRFPASL